MTDAKDAVLEYLRPIGAGLDPDFLREAIKVMTALLMESVIRLVGSVLLEIDNEWQFERRYFSLDSMRKLREPTSEMLPSAGSLRLGPIR